MYPRDADCSDPEPCGMIQQQWKALEEVFEAGKTRAIGVANYCEPCLRCIEQVRCNGHVAVM